MAPRPRPLALLALLLAVLAFVPPTIIASPRPARNPSTFQDLALDASSWSFGMVRNDRDRQPGRFVDQSSGVEQGAGGSGRMRTATTWKYEDCGLPTDAITIKSLAVDPDPPEVGKTLTIEASGTVHTLIDKGAYADVVVKLGAYIKLLQKRFDVCEELKKANATLQCPVKPGDYTLTQSVGLPKEIPKAKFTVDVQSFTQDEEDMSCSKIVIDFMHQ